MKRGERANPHACLTLKRTTYLEVHTYVAQLYFGDAKDTVPTYFDCTLQHSTPHQLSTTASAGSNPNNKVYPAHLLPRAGQSVLCRLIFVWHSARKVHLSKLVALGGRRRFVADSRERERERVRARHVKRPTLRTIHNQDVYPRLQCERGAE